MKTSMKGTIQYRILDIQHNKNAFTDAITTSMVIQPEFYDENNYLVAVFDKQIIALGGCIRLDNVQVQVEIRLV